MISMDSTKLAFADVRNLAIKHPMWLTVDDDTNTHNRTISYQVPGRYLQMWGITEYEWIRLLPHLRIVGQWGTHIRYMWKG